MSRSWGSRAPPSGGMVSRRTGCCRPAGSTGGRRAWCRRRGTPRWRRHPREVEVHPWDQGHRDRAARSSLTKTARPPSSCPVTIRRASMCGCLPVDLVEPTEVRPNVRPARGPRRVPRAPPTEEPSTWSTPGSTRRWAVSRATALPLGSRQPADSAATWARPHAMTRAALVDQLGAVRRLLPRRGDDPQRAVVGPFPPIPVERAAAIEEGTGLGPRRPARRPVSGRRHGDGSPRRADNSGTRLPRTLERLAGYCAAISADA